MGAMWYSLFIMKKIVKYGIAVALVGLIFSNLMVFASIPYQSYIYDAQLNPVHSPDVYVPSKVISGKTLGIGSLKEPTDIVRDFNNNLYIVDSKNNRIIFLNEKYELIKVLSDFTNAGKAEKLNAPNNVFVTKDNLIYISDTGNKRIVISTFEGEIKSIIQKPESDIFPQEKDFVPLDLVVTSSGVLYVMADGIYQGAVVFDKNNKFDGFYGSNKVEPSVELMVDLVWKQFATKKQKENMKRYVPVQYSSLAIDSEDFVYTTVASAKNPQTRVRKLNPMGDNILAGTDNSRIFFGDLESYSYKGEKSVTVLSSVDVVDDKLITVLDRKNKKIYQYNQEGKLITIFGGSGNFNGVFVDPIAICAHNQNVLVLDSKKGEATVFTMTEYGEILLKAIDSYAQGLYCESMPYWQDVLKYNSTSALANLGYGKALYQMGDYKGAMASFKKANEKERYSEAFKEYRDNAVRENFSLIIAILVIVFLLIVVIIKFKLYKKIKFKKITKKE